MSIALEKLIDEFEKVLIDRGSSIDAPVREMFQCQIAGFRKAMKEEDANRLDQVQLNVLQALASLLTIVTNVADRLS